MPVSPSFAVDVAEVVVNCAIAHCEVEFAGNLPQALRSSPTPEFLYLINNERDRLLAAFSESDWNKTAAARRLYWSRMTLYRKITKYKLNLKEPSKRYAS